MVLQFFPRQLGIHKVLAYSNILETIPVSLFSLKNLAELDLSNNVLCAIPDALGTDMTNLTHLVSIQNTSFFFINRNGPNKQECLSLTSLSIPV